MEAYGDILLLSDFKLRQEGDTVTYAVRLPGTIQNSLMELGVIPHHFVGQNEGSSMGERL